jgi:hypothetical protein
MAPEVGKPIHQLPLIPANVLKKHCVHEPLDTRFRSAARLLQALWREDRNLPIGSYVSEHGKRRKLGSRQGRRQFPHPRDRPYRPARGRLSRDRRAHRRGAARDKPPVEHAAHLQFAGALGARARTRLRLSDRAAAGLHRRRAPAPLRTFPRPRQPKIHG